MYEKYSILQCSPSDYNDLRPIILHSKVLAGFLTDCLPLVICLVLCMTALMQLYHMPINNATTSIMIYRGTV